MGVLIIGFCVVWIIYTRYLNYRLRNNYQIATGHVYACSAGGKGNFGKIYADYTYSINGRKYTGSSMYNSSEVSYKICNEFFVGKNFVLVYDPGKYSNSHLLITPNHYRHYHILFPDSLSWVKTVINK